jgi:hypothetical protein
MRNRHVPEAIGGLIAILWGVLSSALGSEPESLVGLQPGERAVLDVVPSLSELGAGWTTNVVAFLLDPHSHPSEIDSRGDARTSPELSVQREIMKTNNRTGCGLVLYGRGDLIMNRGLYRVYIQRWSDRRSLHNSWVGWKMNPNRVVRDAAAVGEDCFWVNEWWRQTLVRQNFVFRQGLFHVVVEAGPDSDAAHMVLLARAIRAKILGRPIPAFSRARLLESGGRPRTGSFQETLVGGSILE